MPKEHKTLRLPKDVLSFIEEYQQTYNLPSFSDAVVKLIKENDRLHLYIKYLGSMQETTTEAPQCLRRLLIEGEFYCVQTNRKGLQKLKKLPLLDICRICRLEKLHIPASTKVKPMQTIRDPAKSKTYREAGMLYCNNGGLMVYPSKCLNCTSKCRNYYDFMKQKTT